jgi:pimeloyl-ACP methyl ester carboxylesterase
MGAPTLPVGHSYGGFVMTNTAYNNPDVNGLVYIAAFAPNEVYLSPIISTLPSFQRFFD